jgi:hypothetical protein
MVWRWAANGLVVMAMAFALRRRVAQWPNRRV